MMFDNFLALSILVLSSTGFEETEQNLPVWSFLLAPKRLHRFPNGSRRKYHGALVNDLGTQCWMHQNADIIHSQFCA